MTDQPSVGWQGPLRGSWRWHFFRGSRSLCGLAFQDRERPLVRDERMRQLQRYMCKNCDRILQRQAAGRA